MRWGARARGPLSFPRRSRRRRYQPTTGGEFESQGQQGPRAKRFGIAINATNARTNARFLCHRPSPQHVKADPSLPPGRGDKRVLRAVAALLGLHEAAGRPKRAIQFGSRIAKLSNVRDFGSNRQANAMNAGTVVLPDAM